jgi:hypothetical protein
MENNIKIDLTERVCENIGWNHEGLSCSFVTLNSSSSGNVPDFKGPIISLGLPGEPSLFSFLISGSLLISFETRFLRLSYKTWHSILKMSAPCSSEEFVITYEVITEKTTVRMFTATEIINSMNMRLWSIKGVTVYTWQTSAVRTRHVNLFQMCHCFNQSNLHPVIARRSLLCCSFSRSLYFIPTPKDFGIIFHDLVRIRTLLYTWLSYQRNRRSHGGSSSERRERHVHINHVIFLITFWGKLCSVVKGLFFGVFLEDSSSIQSVPGGKLIILGGHCTGHSKQKVLQYPHVSCFERFPR